MQVVGLAFLADVLFGSSYGVGVCAVLLSTSLLVLGYGIEVGVGGWMIEGV